MRHPGYVAFILRPVCSGLALGSRWSLAPLAITILLTVYWTVLKDETLRDGFDAYARYAESVRHRLVPGL